MSSGSPPMDYQKPVKVKSRWTQSCQMEMLMEESQSSLDMSDMITDVSTSDLNDISDYNSELNSVELSESCRTSNKIDFRQLNGLKTTQKQTSTSSKISNEVVFLKKPSLNSFDIENENKLNDYMLHKLNIITHPSENIKKIHQMKKQSMSVNNIDDIVIKNILPKPIRRASLSWKFTFTPINEIKNNNSYKENDIHYNFSNKVENSNLNNTLLEIITSTTSNEQLYKDNKLPTKHNTMYENTFQKLISDINALHFGDVNEQINNNISINKLKEERTYQISNIVKPNFSELQNVQFSSIYRSRRVRSKSLDLSTIKANNNIKRSKSYNDINKLIDSVTIDDFKIIPKKKSLKKERRQSKRIKPKDNYIELLGNIIVPVVNYDKEADEIFKEHKNQLAEARINDKEFDEKLKSTNFTLINENVYRPNRQTLKLCPPSEISALRKLKQRVISGDINDYCECTLTKEDIIKGNTGCDDRCLNRLLKVECGLGCSLKHYCTNKQFQNKQFKKTNIFKTEYKGYGICAVEDIPKGFLISEFVGEVIDYNEMCKRLKKKEYNNLNYMVQLNPDEIIDSTSKGNITRFINHSCDPNSVGEKWHVLGQSRIGFFSTRHIKEGEEITFDYSFQIFGNDAQVCYCGSSNCRGYISKAPQSLNSSDDGDDATEINFISKPETQKRKTNLKKRIISNDNNKLRELSRQLTEVAKLKTGCKADQEMATLNLNRLMVHITDSVSRLHVLKFIREHDMNKRLFMDFSGLSIIHNWMTSNENESFKLMILDILDELPIMNRNTITKSKVLDVVSEWAGIPQDIKTKIENLEYSPTELQKHTEEINNMLPKMNEDNEIINDLVNKAISLWKKWIVLKMVYKIPKKMDQPKTIKEVNSCKPTQDIYPSPVDISVLDHKTFKISNKYGYKVRNQQTIPLERIKLRKEYELKVEHERQQIFRKKVMDNWFEQREEVVKKQYKNYSHKPTLDYLNCGNFNLNQSNNVVKQARWDCPSQVRHIRQNSINNYNMQNPCLNFMTSQTLQQPSIPFQPFPYMQPQLFPNYNVVNQPTFFNTPPPPLPSKLNAIQPQIPFISNNKPISQNTEPLDVSPTRRLLKSADSKIFKIINNSLHKHYANKNENIIKIDKMEESNKLCSRDVQSGADLLARIKLISNSFKKQPSKLITINNLKQKNNNSKQEKLPLSSTILKSVCNKNKRITFINEQVDVSSNTLNEDVLPIPKNIPLSGNNKFANVILNSLIKNSVPEKENVSNKFVLPNLNSEVITCEEINKEIELYKNEKPKIIKKVVGYIQTKNNVAVVKKRQWANKLKGLKKMDKIPVTKQNVVDTGKLTFKTCHMNTTKSVLKKISSNETNVYLKRPKEKRVTFLIEGETSPIYPYSDVQSINLNENTVKEKPLMKCHPFTRDESKCISQSSVSIIQDNDLHIERSFETTNDQIIPPIVAKFKASRNRRISLRDKSVILEQLRSQRKHKIPVSMLSLSVDVLKLIPDNRKEMKKVIDYYHSMATVIVKTLGSYAKKTCLQGRIRSDDDFKYLAKKINENVLLKELQLKKVDKLKISNSTKEKVAEYIRKYMSRFGEVYKRKFNEQTNNQKTK